MEIFLSAEAEGPATSKWFVLQKEFSAQLEKLKGHWYGNDLSSIGIISIIMRDEFFINGGYRERKYYSKERKEADIRLKIDYYSFVNASEQDRRKIYVEHILDSIRIAGAKVGCQFDVEHLLLDVTNLLYELL